MDTKMKQWFLRAVMYSFFLALTVSAFFIESCSQPVVVSRLDPITQPGLQSSFGALSMRTSNSSKHSLWFQRVRQLCNL